jgi:hypothetical protein
LSSCLPGYRPPEVIAEDDPGAVAEAHSQDADAAERGALGPAHGAVPDQEWQQQEQQQQERQQQPRRPRGEADQPWAMRSVSVELADPWDPREVAGAGRTRVRRHIAHFRERCGWVCIAVRLLIPVCVTISRNDVKPGWQ